MALIRTLEVIPITYYHLISHIIGSFDQLHDMLKTARDRLTNALDQIGFRLTDQTRFDAFMTLIDFDVSDCRRHEYVTVKCKFVFARKYEVLELVTQFKSGCVVLDHSNITWWVTDKLELDPYDDNYSLNKAIITHKGFSIDILEVASDVSDLFRSRYL